MKCPELLPDTLGNERDFAAVVAEMKRQAIESAQKQMEARLRKYSETAERDSTNYRNQAIKKKMDDTEPLGHW